MNIYIQLIVAWLIYYTLHSVLAADAVKNYIKRLTGRSFRYYRMAYSTLSILGLFGLLFFNASIPGDYFFNNQGIVRYASLVCAAFGVILIRASFKQYDFNAFVGFNHEDTDDFKKDGILQHIRHPIYAGTILLVIGFWLFTPNLPTAISAGCTLIYLVIGMMLEERKLIKKFGTKYLAYKKQVPALFPKLKF